MSTEQKSVVYLVVLATGAFAVDKRTENLAAYSERHRADGHAKDENIRIGALVAKKNAVSAIWDIVADLMRVWEKNQKTHSIDDTSQGYWHAYETEYKRVCGIIGFDPDDRLPWCAEDYFRVYVEEVKLNP